MGPEQAAKTQLRCQLSLCHYILVIEIPRTTLACLSMALSKTEFSCFGVP